MSKKITKDLQELAQIISCYPNGLSIKELSSLLTATIPKRTLQYRLSHLVKKGIIKMEGAGRNSKYHITKNLDSSTLKIKPTDQTSVIPLSQQASALQRIISFPITLRQHISYKREFIDSYKPNKTFYLTEPILDKLMQIGTSVNHRNSLKGTLARKMYPRILIDLSWNSSRLEGNTYSILETEKLLATGEKAPGKDFIETQMILNHKDAIEFIVDMAEEIDINSYTILNIHALLSHNLLIDPKGYGRLRSTPVKISQSLYHPMEVPTLIEELFLLIIQKANAIKNPFEQSFFLMVHLPYLQPFLDINKRVSRLAGNIPFIRENLSPLTFVDVPENEYIQGLLAIYELNRIELFRDVFVWAYERSASFYLVTLEAMGQLDPFQVRYRDQIRQGIFHIVEHKMNKSAAFRFIGQFAHEKIPSQDCHQFIEVIQAEISSLHEGNFARFKIKPSQFFEWQKKGP